jgi:hypothetical protein
MGCSPEILGRVERIGYKEEAVSAKGYRAWKSLP